MSSLNCGTVTVSVSLENPVLLRLFSPLHHVVKDIGTNQDPIITRQSHRKFKFQRFGVGVARIQRPHTGGFKTSQQRIPQIPLVVHRQVDRVGDSGADLFVAGVLPLAN